MTRLAIYESGQGKQELKIAKYFKKDYIKYNVLKTAVVTTVCYWLAVVLVALVNMSKLIDNLADFDYMTTLRKLMIGFVVAVVGYALFARIYYAIRYEKIRKHVVVYNHYLKKMEDFYKAGVNDQPKNVKVRGTIGNNDEFINY